MSDRSSVPQALSSLYAMTQDNQSIFHFSTSGEAMMNGYVLRLPTPTTHRWTLDGATWFQTVNPPRRLYRLVQRVVLGIRWEEIPPPSSSEP